MTQIIIPIKDLSCAKQRLSSVLTSAARAGLVFTMLEDLLTTLSELDRGHIWVVASNDSVFDIARKFSARPIIEDQTLGYNEAVALGLSALAANSSVAVLPGDVPLATSYEISALIAPVNDSKPAIRLAAARDRFGTNGLFLSSPELICPGFGPNSFAGYQRAALASKIEPAILEAPGLAHDIDTPTDLRDFLATSARCATTDFLCSLDSRDISPGFNEGAAA